MSSIVSKNSCVTYSELCCACLHNLLEEGSKFFLEVESHVLCDTHNVKLVLDSGSFDNGDPLVGNIQSLYFPLLHFYGTEITIAWQEAVTTNGKDMHDEFEAFHFHERVEEMYDGVVFVLASTTV